MPDNRSSVAFKSLEHGDQHCVVHYAYESDAIVTIILQPGQRERKHV
jgi:hypothetical protein